MRTLSQDLKQLWRAKATFKVAACYLLLFVLLVVLLPVLPVSYSPNELDLAYTFASPLTKGTSGWHWLGTDGLGRDVWSNILHGARSALFVSLPVMLFATALGLAIGISGGYFGDKGLKVSRASFMVSFVALLAILYYGVYLPLNLLKLGLPFGWQVLALLFILLPALYLFILPLLKRWRFAAASFSFPLDYLALRFTEAFTSVPRLLLILALASFMRPSVLLLSGVFVATFWTSFARLARAETLKIKELPYFEAAQSLGVPQLRLLTRHILPGMLGPIVVTFTFSLAGLMTLESTLSFLGIGVPGTFVSWGRIISGIRSNTSAWWLVVFPGLALATTVWALQTISYHFLNHFEERK